MSRGGKYRRRSDHSDSKYRVSGLPMVGDNLSHDDCGRTAGTLNLRLDGVLPWWSPMSRKALPMQNITIGRYKAPQCDQFPLGITLPVSSVFDGWIEGVRDDGSTWIMWLDATGNPFVYYGQRDASGAVEGEPVVLAPGHPFLDDDEDDEDTVA